MVNDRDLSYLLRSGSSISLKEHSSDSPSLLPSRSSQVLVNRGSLYPALPPDLSVLVTEETTQRRTLHKQLMEKSPGIFKRFISEESPSFIGQQQYKMKDLMEGLHEDQKPSRSSLHENDLAEIKKIQSMRPTPSLRSLGLTREAPSYSTTQYYNYEDIDEEKYGGNSRPLTSNTLLNKSSKNRLSSSFSNESTPDSTPRNVKQDQETSSNSSLGSSSNTFQNNERNNNNNSLETKKSISSSIISIEDYLKKISKNNFEQFCKENNNNININTTIKNFKNFDNSKDNKKKNSIEINKTMLFNNNISLKSSFLANNNDEMKKDMNEFIENKQLNSFYKSKKWHSSYLERKNDYYETKSFSNQLYQYKQAQNNLAKEEQEDIGKFEESLKLRKFNIGTKGYFD